MVVQCAFGAGPMADDHATLRLAEQLIARPSLTPDDAGCQRLIAERLSAAGFRCTHLPRGDGPARVDNLWALRSGTAADAPLLVFAGHTDVVPTGPTAQWQSDPFVPTHRDGRLYGRGAADMKSSLAAMVIACERFVAEAPGHAGSVALLLTSDEEGPATHGTRAVCDWLQAEGVRIDHCIVGEPTSVERLGDTVKTGRRGSLSGRLTVYGKQGHIAYPQLASNPIHLVAAALAELAATAWDAGNSQFPPTSFQCSNIHAGTGAGNVIPGELVVDFNFRYAPVCTPADLQTRVAEVLARHGVPQTLDWTLGGLPYQTAEGSLSAALAAAIALVTGEVPAFSTTGGTSDGRFIARICPQVVEFGPVNASIHQIDEHVAVDSITPLTRIYQETLRRLIA